MKKLVSVLLALIFLSQSMPVNALAEALYPAPTAQELTAAVALTGLDDSSPGYHPGMKPSTSMNALQLSGWIEEFQDQKLAHIMDIFENYDVELAYIRETYPVSFEILMNVHQTGIGRFYDEYSEAMGWKDDVARYRERLDYLSREIDILAIYLQEENLSEREQVIYAYEIRDKWQTLKDLIPETVARTELWSEEYDRLEKLLAGPYAYSGDPNSLAWLLDVVDNLRLSTGQATLKEATVSASAVRVQPAETVMTRLARLSPINSALADSDQTMVVKILDDKYFYIKAVAGSINLEGASVSVADQGKSGAKTMATESTGYAGFAVSDFQTDDEGWVTLNVTVEKEGYRRVEAAKMMIMKGSGVNIPMEEENGDPYPVSMSFWGHDVQIADYVVVNSPFNDTKQTFSTKIKAEDSYTVKMYHFTAKDGYDVIDFDHWVADITEDFASYLPSGSALPLKDALFTVCILAKDYHDEQQVLEDGTVETVKVPDETWAYVQCWCLYRNEFLPVLLEDEKDSNNYLALCYPLREGGETCPSGNPHIVGALRKRYNTPLYQFEVITNSLSVDGREKNGYFIAEVVYAEDNYARRLRESKIDRVVKYTRNNYFMQGRQFYDFQFVAGDMDYFFDLYLSGEMGKETDYYDLTFGFDKVTYGNLTPLIIMDSGKSIMSGVASFAARRGTGGKPHLFVVQQDESGECCRLMGCEIGDIYESGTQVTWTVVDYDIEMPRANLYWTKLCGRECVYWMETVGQTEDGKGNLFKARGVWYDETADAVSEPFIIATVKTPTADGVPSRLYLTNEQEGYYFVTRENGESLLNKFTFQLTPGLKLLGNTLADTLVTVGSYDDMLLTVYNNGNAPLTGFDLVAYHSTGSQQAKTFETIHVDLLNPSKGSITYEDMKFVLKWGFMPWLEIGKTTMYGENIARSVPCMLNNDSDEYRYVKKSDYLFLYTETKLMNQEQALMKPTMLMPGKYASYNISLYIPKDWEGTHVIYLETDRYYLSTDSKFQRDVSASNANGGMPLMASSPQQEIVSVGKDGTVRRENGGGMLLTAASNGGEEAREDFSYINTDVTFDRITLNSQGEDLSLTARLWDSGETPMVTLTLTNAANKSGGANMVVMEAYLDDETTPVFRYSLPEEVSDKATWNFDLPLSLLTGGRTASKVTVTVNGKNYKEVGEVDNSAVILLDAESLSFITQPESIEVPEGSEAVFHGAVYGGRTPYRYQWQVKTPKGSWTNIEGETGNTLTLRAVTKEMNDNRYRLTVTDASGRTVTSSAAALTIKGVPHTGDTAPILWYAIGILAAGSVIAWFVLRKKKERR